MEPEGSLAHLVPTTCPYSSQINSDRTRPSSFLKIHFNVVLPHVWIIQVGSFPQVSTPNPCIHPSFAR